MDMTKHKQIEKDLFLRNARGDEFYTYAALVTEADALHHVQVPSLIKPPERARPSEQEFMAWLNDPDRMLDVAVEKTETGRVIAGLIQASVLTRHEDRIHMANRMARIDLVVVKESHRRRGIGRALLMRARHWAKDKAATGMALDV